MAKRKVYDNEYKIQAIQLAEKLGGARAADELGISRNTPKGMVNPEDALSLIEELIKLRSETRKRKKEIARLKETNEFLKEASAFFATRRRK